MFEFGKVFWFLVHPVRLAFFLLCLGVILLYTRRWRAGRALLATLLAVSVLLGVAPVGDWLLYRLEHRFPALSAPPPRADGIIMLGGEIDAERTLATGQPVLSRSGRLLAFADLARRFPAARLVFTGGSGNLFDHTVTEAAGMPLALRAVGMDPDRVQYENRSRNTYENAVFSRELVMPKPGETWLLITDAWHTPRAVGSFRQAGFAVTPYPVGFRTSDRGSAGYSLSFGSGFFQLIQPLREIAGLIAYRVMGYTDALFPAP